MMQSQAIPTADEQKYIWYHSCKHANVRRRFPDGSVDFGQSYAMNETTIHPSVSCQKITFYEADQMDKSLRCKIKSEWEEREEVKKNTEERMFVNKIAIVVKFHAAVKTESTCVCCFYRNLRVIGFFYFLLIFLLYLIGFFSVLVTANTFFIELRYIITYFLLIEFISKKKNPKTNNSTFIRIFITEFWSTI